MERYESARNRTESKVNERSNFRLIIRRYGFAALTVFLAWSATSLARIKAPHQPLTLVFFFAAVALSAGVAGLGPGVFATILAALTCDYFFLTPLHSLVVSRTDFPLLVLFLLVAVLINILSERLQARTKAVEQRFHDRVQGLGAIIWAADPQTLGYTFVSQRAEAILGYPIARWLDDPEFRRSLVHSEDRDRVLEAYRKCVREGGDLTLEYRALAADNREVWLRETLHIARDERGQPVRVTGLCVDITERKQAEEEIAELQEELATLNSITSAMTTSLELPTVLAILKQQLRDHLHIPGGLLFLIRAEDARWSLADGWGMPQPEQTLWETALTGVFSDLHIPQQGSLLPQKDNPSPLAALASLREALPQEWQTYLWMPLIANGERQGAVCLFDTASFRLGEDRLAFFEMLGGQAGVIVQNARLYGQVRVGQENLQLLSHRLVEVQEEERRRIARELHDEIGQVLTGLKFHLEAGARPSAKGGQDSLREALALVNELMMQVQNLSLDLRPVILDDLGLLPALLWHFERYTHLTGVNVDFEHNGLEQRFAHEVETTVYRIVQEALTNVARHSETDTATVRLWQAQGLLMMRVVDHGCGFDAGAIKSRMETSGLTGMRERVALLGGHLLVESAPGKGTCLMADLPLDTGKKANAGLES